MPFFQKVEALLSVVAFLLPTNDKLNEFKIYNELTINHLEKPRTNPEASGKNQDKS